MSLKHNFCHDRGLKLSAYEEMIDGQSYVTVHYGTEEMRLPIQAWRVLNDAWNQKRWDVKFDDLDNCVPVLEQN